MLTFPLAFATSIARPSLSRPVSFSGAVDKADGAFAAEDMMLLFGLIEGVLK